MKKEIRKFLTITDQIIKDYIKECSIDLIEKDPDEYYLETTDYGYYNNGVGFASCGGQEDIYDEDRAYDDAINNLKEELDNPAEDFYYRLTQNKEFVEALNNIIETYRR